MDSTQRTILKATILMPIMVPIGWAKLVWRRIFPKKGNIIDSE